MNSVAILERLNITEADAVAFEKALVENDLSKLTVLQRLALVKATCESAGLNYLTSPLQYVWLKGPGGEKLCLYARKDCTDQLRKIHGISVVRLEKETVGDLYMVTAYGKDKTGREDSDFGAVSLIGRTREGKEYPLKGESLANAMMKAVTKAKRRMTLSLSGFGILDETEIEDIPRDQRREHIENPLEVVRLEREVAAAEPKPEPKAPPPPKPEPVNHAPNAQGGVSDAQIKRLYAIAKNLGWTEPDLKKVLLDGYGHTSTRQLTSFDYNELCEAIESGQSGREIVAGKKGEVTSEVTG